MKTVTITEQPIFTLYYSDPNTGKEKNLYIGDIKNAAVGDVFTVDANKSCIPSSDDTAKIIYKDTTGAAVLLQTFTETPITPSHTESGVDSELVWVEFAPETQPTKWADEVDPSDDLLENFDQVLADIAQELEEKGAEI